MNTPLLKPSCRNPDAAGKYRIGCGVSAPVILYQELPAYPEEARLRKLSTSGIVISLTVDVDGRPTDVHVKESMVDRVAQVDRAAQQRLEDRMVESVRHFKIKPATFQSKAVPVEMNVEINIDLF